MNLGRCSTELNDSPDIVSSPEVVPFQTTPDELIHGQSNHSPHAEPTLLTDETPFEQFEPNQELDRSENSSSEQTYECRVVSHQVGSTSTTVVLSQTYDDAPTDDGQFANVQISESHEITVLTKQIVLQSETTTVSKEVIVFLFCF